MSEEMHAPTVASVPIEHPDSNDWRMIGMAVGIAILCVVGLYWETVQSMVATWAGSRTFMHGFLVLPVAGYLVWCRRHLWIPQVPNPSVWAVLALVPLGIFWYVGEITNLIWIQQTAFVGMLPALVWAMLGNNIIKILAWPLAFLVFMIPVGTALDPWLQDFTARFIEIGLELAGIPYLYKDRQFVMTSGIWEVAPDCGGLRYLLPGLALGYAFVTLMYQRSSRRLLFLFLCVIVLMTANGLRAFGVIVGDHFGYADGADHRLFSYSIYGLTMPVLFWFGLRWEETPTNACVLPSMEACSPFDDRGPIRMAIIALAVLAVAPLAAWWWPHLP